MELLRDFKKLSKDDVGLAGGKGASLGEMTRAGIPVPPGFVILADSFEKFIEETELIAEIDAILDSVNHKEIHTVENASEKIKALILGADMPKDIALEIKSSFKKLGAKYVAVRSSATAEDSSSAAWAGQLESYLNTTEKDLLLRVKQCWASLFTPRAIFYRFEKELHKQKISVAVVVQKMVESEISGIAFSVHPVTKDRNQLIIEASYGLGEAIVSGQVTPDSYVVEKSPRRIIERTVQNKARGMYRSAKNENEWRTIRATKAEAQALSDAQISKLSELILRIEGHYGFPCDIEWAFEKGKFYIVQSRPITTLSKQEDVNKIIFEKIYTRDTTYIMQELWAFGCSRGIEGEFGWKNPYLPGIIHYMNQGSIEIWENLKATEWLEDVVLKENKKNPRFIDKILKQYEAKLKIVHGLWKKKNLGINDLMKLIATSREAMPYFVAYYYSAVNNETPKTIRTKALAMRNKDEFFAQNDIVIRNSISALYPQMKNYETTIFIDELKKIPAIKLLKERKQHSLIIQGKDRFIGSLSEFENANPQFSFKKEYVVIDDPDVITGEIAQKGKVTGRVKILRRRDQIDEVQGGDVIVSPMTTPDFLPAMRRAVAFVTDEGGITCHAGIVARELKKPCIIGTKIATEVLKDGDMVEVDANMGMVRKIKGGGNVVENLIEKYNINPPFIEKAVPAHFYTVDFVQEIWNAWGDYSSGYYPLFLFIICEQYGTVFYLPHGLTLLRDHYFSKLAKDKKYLFKHYADWQKARKHLEKEISVLDKAFEKKDFKNIFAAYKNFAQAYIFEYALACVPQEAFGFQPELWIDPEIKAYCEQYNLHYQETSALLTSPVALSFIAEEELGLLRVALLLGIKKYAAALSAHRAKWFWVRNNYFTIEALSEKFFDDRVKGFVKKGTAHIKSEIKKIESSTRVIASKKKALFKKHTPSKKLVSYVEMVELFAEMQDVRKGFVLYANHYHKLFLVAVAKEFKEPIADLWYHSYKEMMVAIETGTFLPQAVIDERKKIMVVGEGKDEKVILTGADALALADHLQGKKIVGAAQKLSKFMSREHSFFYAHIWNEANRDHFDRYVPGINIRSMVFLRNAGILEIYYDLAELDKAFVEIVEAIKKDPKILDRIIKDFYVTWKKLWPYISRKKEIKNVKELKRYYEQCVEWWVPMAYIFVIPDQEQLPKSLRDKAFKVRKETQEYSDDIDRIYNDFIKKYYPHYVSIAGLLSPDEVYRIGKLTEKEIAQITKRKEGWALVTLGDASKFVSGNEARTEVQAAGFALEDVSAGSRGPEATEIKGQIAQSGKVTGAVKIVLRMSDVEKVKAGDILVSSMTRPEMIAAMQKAAAFVTDEGGITCHAAIISREMKKPCIIGTKIATKVLKDGDMVEVDADNGIVRKTS